MEYLHSYQNYVIVVLALTLALLTFAFFSAKSLRQKLATMDESAPEYQITKRKLRNKGIIIGVLIGFIIFPFLALIQLNKNDDTRQIVFELRNTL